MLLLGILCVLLALACLGYLVLGSAVPKIDISRRRPPGEQHPSTLTRSSDAIVAFVDRLLSRRGWVPFPARERELAGVTMSSGSLVVMIAALYVTVMAVVYAVTGMLPLGLLIGLLVPVGAKTVLRQRAAKRRQTFADQLDESLALMASALRAGHSLVRALDTVSREAASPTAEEFARIVNENRIGRDLVEAMHMTAERMENEDFGWITDAVAIQRDTGGNLNEVLERIAGTIRERNQIKREVHTLSAEGRMSAIILMALPIVTAVGMSVVNPGYMSPLFDGATGIIVLCVAAVMFAIGAVWMRAVVNVKV